MEKLDIVTRWNWRPNQFHCQILEIHGGTMPDQIRNKLQHTSPPSPPRDSEMWRLGEKIANALLAHLPPITPIDLGTQDPFEGMLTGIQLVDSRSSSSPTRIYMSYYIEYPNAMTAEESHTWRVQDLPPILQDMNSQLHRRANEYVKEWFAEMYGGGEINPEKWKAQKTEVFISYRATFAEVAKQLFDYLGEYENRTIFLPRMDLIDMQAGNWLDQLMKMIDKCQVSIPILSNDYLEGPISRPELDEALRLHLYGTEKRIIPVLIEGAPKDYQNHFIGGFHMVQALKGIVSQKGEEIAYFALGLSKNPYESP